MNRFYAVEMETFWQRAQPVQVSGQECLALCPQDLLMHISIHLAYQHVFRIPLSALVDVAQTLAWSPLDWDRVRERAADLGLERGLYMTLYLARELAAAPVPDDALEMLRPRDNAGLEAILAAARDQILASTDQHVVVPQRLARLWSARGLGNKLKVFGAHAFAAPAELAGPDGSVNWRDLFRYYPHRLGHLLRYHGRTAWNLLRGQPAIRTPTERANSVLDWLEQGSGTRDQSIS